jgi:hypothetical protein
MSLTRLTVPASDAPPDAGAQTSDSTLILEGEVRVFPAESSDRVETTTLAVGTLDFGAVLREHFACPEDADWDESCGWLRITVERLAKPACD